MRKNSLLIALAIVLCLLPLSARATDERTIPIKEGTVIGGAAEVVGELDIMDSPYFKQLDFYNMESTDTLTILPQFKTYQQTTESTCGPASILMVLEYYGKTDDWEMNIAEICETSVKGPGTDTEGMVKYFESIGWTIESSLSEEKEASLDMLLENLKNGIPTMVEWIDWGGHWQVVIGYDTMGTDYEYDDVIILADPYDTTDHLQDGYYIYPADRFQYMWFDAHILPESMRTSPQWLTAVPPQE